MATGNDMTSGIEGHRRHARWLRRSAALLCAVAACAPGAPALAAEQETRTFSPTGAMQTYTVPEGVHRLTITAIGAGGGMTGITTLGGRGTAMTGTFDVTPGAVLNVVVGKAGGSPVTSGASAGGGGGSFVYWPGATLPMIAAAGGGGAGGGQSGGDGLTGDSGGAGYPERLGGTVGLGGWGGGFADGWGGGGGGAGYEWAGSSGAAGDLAGDGGGGGQSQLGSWTGGSGGSGGGAGGFGGGGGGGYGGGGYSGGGGGGGETGGMGRGGGGGSWNWGDNRVYGVGASSNQDGLVTISHDILTPPVGVTFRSSRHPAPGGDTVRFTFGLGGTLGKPVPQGTVRFEAGDTAIDGCEERPVSGQIAVCTTNSLAVGTHTITAHYSGDAYWAPTTASLTQTIELTAPGAPWNVTAVAGEGEATVSFSEPGFDGGAPITGYTVTSSPEERTCSTDGELSCTVTGLTNGTTYTFTVTADNSVGTGPQSTESAAITPQIRQTITFDDPGAQTYGTRPTLVASASSGLPVSFSSTTGGVCTVSDAGVLTTVRAGTCTIRAEQPGDATRAPAPPQERTFAIVAVVPGAPRDVAATAAVGEATVAFAAPDDDGGAPIEQYTVTSSPHGRTCTTSGELSCTVSGLTNGTAYTFTVTATSSAGTGPAATPSAPVTPMALQEISFENPGPIGFGSRPTLVATATSGLPVVFSSTTAATCTISDAGLLTTVSVGRCTIRAEQPGDDSRKPASPREQSFAIVAVVPGAPGGVTATAGDGEATVSFAPPSSDGGIAVTGYTVTSSPGGHACATAGALTCTVTGLENGTTYTFTVTAANTLGTGPASPPSPGVTPSGAGDGASGSGGGGAGQGGGGAPAPGEPLNGENASGDARMCIGADVRRPCGSGGARRLQDAVTVAVARGRRVQLVGRLVDPAGAPIAGAAITVRGTSAVRGARVVQRTIRTDRDGIYRYATRPSGSQTVTFGYKRRSDDRAFAGTAVAVLAVRTDVSLRLDRRSGGGDEQIVLRGRVAGAPPASRHQVQLQARVGRTWRTVATARLRRGGFRFDQRLAPASSTVRLRARVLAATGWPFVASHSAPVAVDGRALSGRAPAAADR